MHLCKWDTGDSSYAHRLQGLLKEQRCWKISKVEGWSWDAQKIHAYSEQCHFIWFAHVALQRAVNCLSLTAVRVNTGSCYVLRWTRGSSHVSRSFWLWWSQLRPCWESRWLRRVFAMPRCSRSCAFDVWTCDHLVWSPVKRGGGLKTLKVFKQRLFGLSVSPRSAIV